MGLRQNISFNTRYLDLFKALSPDNIEFIEQYINGLTIQIDIALRNYMSMDDRTMIESLKHNSLNLKYLKEKYGIETLKERLLNILCILSGIYDSPVSFERCLNLPKQISSWVTIVVIWSDRVDNLKILNNFTMLKHKDKQFTTVDIFTAIHAKAYRCFKYLCNRILISDTITDSLLIISFSNRRMFKHLLSLTDRPIELDVTMRTDSDWIINHLSSHNHRVQKRIQIDNNIEIL
jgi:hypothetical protein